MEVLKVDGDWSKTKIGASLVALSLVLGTVGAYLTGSIELTSFLGKLAIEIGGFLSVLGLRDAL